MPRGCPLAGRALDLAEASSREVFRAEGLGFRLQALSLEGVCGFVAVLEFLLVGAFLISHDKHVFTDLVPIRNISCAVACAL